MNFPYYTLEILDKGLVILHPKAILPTGTITGCNPITKVHLQVHKPSVDPNAIVLKTPL